MIACLLYTSDPDVTQEQIHEDIKKYVFDPILPAELIDENTKFFINPTGRFVIGGPHGDAGLTGRKIIVDTYGGYARHGGCLLYTSVPFCEQISCLHENLLTKRYEGSATL